MDLKKIVVALIICVLLLYLATGLIIVGPGEIALTQRFGRLLTERQLGPGLHWHLPWPVEKANTISIKEVHRIEIGFRTDAESMEKFSDRSGINILWESKHVGGFLSTVPDESLMITGDENIIDLSLVAHYRISEPSHFMFMHKDPFQLLKNALESAIRIEIGQHSLDILLAEGKDEIQIKIKKRAQNYLDKYKAGIEVLYIMMEDAHPPIEIVHSFRDVSSAKEDKATYINQAYIYQNQVIPSARGASKRTIMEAEANYSQKVDHSQGQADRYKKRYSIYSKHKNITQKRIYLDTTEQILSGNKLLLVDRSGKEKQVQLRFLFSRGSKGKTNYQYLLDD